MSLPKPAKRSAKPRKRIPARAKRKAKLHDADRLFSELIRYRDGWACGACGSPYRPQCAHIVSRRYHATRFDRDNAVCLCAACHTRWTWDPLGWEAWVEERFPGRLAVLKAKAMGRHDRHDYAELCEALRGAIGIRGAR